MYVCMHRADPAYSIDQRTHTRVIFSFDICSSLCTDSRVWVENFSNSDDTSSTTCSFKYKHKGKKERDTERETKTRC